MTTSETGADATLNAPTTRHHRPSSRRGWPLGWLTRNLMLLFAGRALRSLAQAYLVIIVPLYLAQLGFSPTQLGIVFTASAIASALLAAAVGLLSDRLGRKTMLILISLLMAGGGVVFAVARSFWVLVIGGAIGTIGRGGGAGSGGAWGPYYPAETALLAESAGDQRRTTVFGVVSFVGVIAGAGGSLLAIVPGLLRARGGMSVLAGDRALFLLTSALGIALALLVLPIRERAIARPARGAASVQTAPQRAPMPVVAALPESTPARGRFGVSPTTWGLIWRFMVTNATNGLGYGIIGSFLVYWFYRRYGVTEQTLGGLFFVVNLVAAVPYLLSGWVVRRLGAVNTTVVTRGVAVALLVVMVLMPTYALAGLVYLVRTIGMTLSNPVRQSYLMGVVPPEERASAAGLTNLPSQAASAISPVFAGYLIQAVALDLPLLLAAVFQGLNTVLFYVFFRDIHPPEERQRERRQPLDG